MLLFRYLESLSVSLAKEKRWSEAVHVGRKACRAAEEEAKSLCDDGLRPSAPCIEAQLSSSCLMLAIMLRDGSSKPESLAVSEAIFGKILAKAKLLYAEVQGADNSIPPAAARTACR
jgi:hypothetical protein